MSNLDHARRLWRDGRLREALGVAQDGCERDGGSLEQLTLIADMHAALGDAAVAMQFHRRVVALAPQDAAAFRRLAQAEVAAGQSAAAMQSYLRAIELDPRNPRAHNNLGRLLEQAGDRQGARASYRSALALDDGYAIAHNNLGNAAAADGETLAALESYGRAVQLRPDFAEAWHNSAKALLTLRRPAEALASSERAVALKQDLPEAWYVYGEALEAMQRSSEALAACERAIALRTNYPQALFARANLLRGAGEHRAAVTGFRDVLRADSRYAAARLAAVIAEIPALPWSAAEAADSRDAFARGIKTLTAELESNPCHDPTGLVGAVQPFYLAYQERDHCVLLSAHGDLCASEMARWQHALDLRLSAPRGAADRKLRVAIVSAQIAAHSVYDAITRGWLQRLDRARFTLDVFHLGGVVDAETRCAEALADYFLQGPRSLLAWVTAIGERCPDVILYPEIGMDQLTLQLASMRLASVQAAAWGHPVTSGLPTIDYYVSAQALEPCDADRHYREKLVLLPNLGVYCEPRDLAEREVQLGSATLTAAATPSPAALPPPASTRREAGCPLLICAGTPYKYAPEYDDVLVRIAERLGRCQFQFFNYKDGNLSRRLLRRLHAAFDASGLRGAEFLVLRPWAPPADFQDALRTADLFLDTLGFSGFNTVLQALQCGLPVVSHRGRYLRGRLGSGVLEHLGLEELVADDPATYVDITVSLVRDSASRARIGDRIAQRLHRVFCDQSAIEAFESFLIEAHQTASSGGVRST